MPRRKEVPNERRSTTITSILPPDISGVKEANEYLAQPTNYTTAPQALLLAGFLHKLKVGGGVDGITTIEAEEGFYQLSPPTTAHDVHLVLFKNSNAIIAGHALAALGEQHRWLWNIPFVGKLWKLKRYINSDAPENSTTIILGNSDTADTAADKDIAA